MCITVHRTVERDFTIIAEALSNIGRISPEFGERVNSHRQIVNFRNVIVQDYFHVDHAYVWKVIKDEVPWLKKQIEAWKNELDAEKS